MRIAYEANAWGGVVGTPGAVTSIFAGHYVTPGSVEEGMAAIARAGYTGVELFDGNLLPFEGDLAPFRQALHNTGLELAGVYSGGHFIYRDAHADEYARFERSIALAAEAGARHFVIGGGAIRHDGRRDEDFDVMAELLDRVADRARGAGLVPSYHPHLGSLAETGEQVDALFSRSGIALCADVAHLAAAGTDAAALIDRYADRLAYVHMKDVRLVDAAFMPLGAGDMELDAVVEAVVRAGYDDWITVELDGYTGDLDDAAARSLEYLRSRGLAG
ncbi:sugar phosphate isomerase/epimerase family protein [Microbacterium album]|uniref:Inosose dehydratase n=1 Tax=Microbacterium album TaxID=2053191 RepID=A0A917MKD3_9MICO|nr:sugar phosphate isomerase/epimerase [Microbacterium album]GGH35539.1 inosose dehydratase [Microbacterium album]